MKLNDYLQLPPDVRSNVAFIVKQLEKTHKVREVGEATFIIIPELLKATKKAELTRLVNDLFFGWKKLEKYANLHWHVDDGGRIKYFTLPTALVRVAKEYNEKVKR